jgi:hypothetical protein
MGQFEKGKMNGYGELLWPDGKKYYGYYRDGVKHFFGIFLWSQNPLKIYIGSWVEGKQHGVGLTINGKIVRYGYWINGKKEKQFQGLWDMKKYIKSEKIKFSRFLFKDVDEILKFFF